MTSLRLPLLVLLGTLLYAQAPNPEGVWSGTLDAGSAKLRVVLRIVKAADGALSSKLDSLDQGAMGIPVGITTVTGNALKLEVPAVQGGYEGKFTADGNGIEGTWTQGGNNLPLNWKRSSEAEVAPAPAAKGRPLTTEERAALVAHFDRTLKLYLDATANLSDAQLRFKAAPERWSILDVAEHLVAIEDMLFGYATKQVMKIPPKPELAQRTPEQLAAIDKAVLERTVDRSKPGQAPEGARPTGKFASIDAATAAFKERRAAVVAYVKSTEDDLRDHAAPAPGGASVDAYQFLLILAAHTERHVLQINEVKAAGGYPK